MSTRNHVMALIFLMAVLAFTVFAAKRLLFKTSPAGVGGAAMPPHASSAAKPAGEKPSAAVASPANPAHSTLAPANPAPPAPAQSAPAPATPAVSTPARSTPTHSTPAPASPARNSPAPTAPARTVPAASPKSREKVSTPAAGGPVAATPKPPAPPAKTPAPATENHHSVDHRSEDQRPQLRFGSGARLWIQVTAIRRKPDGSFTFRGTLLQPVTLANRNQLDQNTGVAGSGTASNGHVRVQVSGFTVAGANYELQDAGGSNKHPGTGLAVELDPGKLLEVWLASSSVYRRTP